MKTLKIKNQICRGGVVAVTLFSGSWSVYAGQHDCNIYSDQVQKVQNQLADFENNQVAPLRYELDQKNAQIAADSARLHELAGIINQKIADAASNANGANINNGQAADLDAQAAQLRDQARAHIHAGKPDLAAKEIQQAEALENQSDTLQAKADRQTRLSKRNLIDKQGAEDEMKELQTELPSLQNRVSTLYGKLNDLAKLRADAQNELDRDVGVVNLCLESNCEDVGYDSLRDSLQLLKSLGCDAGDNRRYDDGACERKGKEDARQVMGCF